MLVNLFRAYLLIALQVLLYSYYNFCGSIKKKKLVSNLHSIHRQWRCPRSNEYLGYDHMLPFQFRCTWQAIDSLCQEGAKLVINISAPRKCSKCNADEVIPQWSRLANTSIYMVDSYEKCTRYVPTQNSHISISLLSNLSYFLCLDYAFRAICNMNYFYAKCGLYKCMSKKPPIFDHFCKNWNQNMFTKIKKEFKSN